MFEKKNLYIRFALVWTQSNICCGQHFVVKLLFAANGIAMQKGHVKERKGRFGFFVFIKMKKMTLEKFWVSYLRKQSGNVCGVYCFLIFINWLDHKSVMKIFFLLIFLFIVFQITIPIFLTYAEIFLENNYLSH